MSLKHYLEVYSPKRLWRKLWMGFAGLPMLPQHRAMILKLGGVNIRGHALIYGAVIECINVSTEKSRSL